MGKRALFLVVVAATLVAAGGYVAWAATRAQGELAAPTDPALSKAKVPPRESVVYRSLDRRKPQNYGLTAISLMTKADKPTVVSLACERVYFAGGRGLCLARSSGFGSPFRARILGRDLRPVGDVALSGVPSRARISRDGRFGAATTFVSGHSYARPGTFSTKTILIDLVAGKEIAHLEQFTSEVDGEEVDAPDVNYWGVTFARDPNRFYATLATGGKTYLMEGDVRQRRLRALHENVECPSLSPDETRIAYKKRVNIVDGSPSIWQLYVLDLRTNRETALAETRAIDDQVEWLDDETVVYGMDEEVWRVPADGTGVSKRFLRAAASPAIIR